MRSLNRLLTASFFSAAALSSACNGELYLSANDALIDYDPTDRDNGDPIDNGDSGGDADDGGDLGDIDGDSLLGDGFTGGDGDGGALCDGCCETNDDCTSAGAPECLLGFCVAQCSNPPRCGDSQLCCTGETTECCDATVDTTCDQDHCRKPCPSSTDVHCGSNDQYCCDTTTGGYGGRGLECGPQLSCVSNCAATDGPLCGVDDSDPNSVGVCCDGHGTTDSDDDDVCLYGECVARGDHCTTFVDCPNGYYCELTLHNPGYPDEGVCLPDDFPEDTPVCQSPPDDLFSPTTEWAWVGIQIVADSNAWNPGDLVRPCTNNSDTHCYREPCTNFADGTNCYRSVESIPTTADMDKDSYPEVAFKAYADNTFSGNNLLVIIDGRADSALPSDVGQLVNKTHRTKRVIWGETRGHIAIGDIDGDANLELVAAHASGVAPADGVVAYDPFKLANPTGTATANVKVWQYNGGYANNSFTAGAPSLNDLNHDGIPEVIIGPVIMDAASASTSGTLILDLSGGSTAPFGNSATAGCGGSGSTAGTNDCFDITTVADVDDDGNPELLTGNQAIKITYDGTWHSSVLWTAAHDSLAGQSGNSVAYASENTTSRPLGAGFPGVGDFIDNTKAPYNAAPYGPGGNGYTKNTPEVAVIYSGAVFIVSGEDGKVLRTPTPCSPSSASATTDVCLTKFTKTSCEATSGCQWDNAELYVKPLSDRGGPPNIADFDGDGDVEVSFAGTGCMVVVDPQCFVGSANANARDAVANITGSGCGLKRPGASDLAARTCTIGVTGSIANEYGLSWMYQTQDASSAVTGTSVFDFQGDLKAEVLYNDECFFRVFEGSDAAILYERPNSHRTGTEYPIVVDVDGDSNSEIVVVSTGDMAVARDRCGTPNRAGHATCDGKNSSQCAAVANCTFVNNTCIPTTAYSETVCSTATDCNNTSGCQSVSGVCAPFAYYRDKTERYKSNACFCTDHTTQDDCNAGRGCTWNSGAGTCGLIGAAGTYCSSETTRDGCVAKSKDCLWDAYASSTGACVQHPRDQDYICSHATWGVTSFGDTSDQWVRTLPYWHEHDYHITNVSRTGDPLPDWNVCYDNQEDGDIGEQATCAALTTASACEANASCAFGATNPSYYNNFRQNVPGSVPLNEPDLLITSLIADLRNCPPSVTLIATVMNNGRAGIDAGAPVGFYRMTTSETVQQTAARTDLIGGSTVPTTVNLLPGQSTQVQATYTLTSTEAAINLSFRAIVDPVFVLDTDPDPEDPNFECNANNNSADISNIDCIDTGS